MYQCSDVGAKGLRRFYKSAVFTRIRPMESPILPFS